MSKGRNSGSPLGGCARGLLKPWPLDSLWKLRGHVSRGWTAAVARMVTVETCPAYSSPLPQILAAQSAAVRLWQLQVVKERLLGLRAVGRWAGSTDFGRRAWWRDKVAGQMKQTTTSRVRLSLPGLEQLMAMCCPVSAGGGVASAAVALVQHFREAATLYANKERLRYATNIETKAARRAAQVAAAPAVSSRRGAPPHSIRANRRRPPLDEGRYVPPQMSVILELQEKNFFATSSSSSLPTLTSARVFPSRCMTKLTTEEQASSRAAKNASRGAELDLLLFDRVFQQDNIMAKTTAWDKTMTPTMDAKLLAEVVNLRTNRSLLLDQLLVKEVGAVHAAEEGGARGSGGSGGGAGEGGGANPPADASAELHPQQSDLPMASLVFGGDGGTEEAMDLDDLQHQQPVGAGGLGVFSMQADPVGASAPDADLDSHHGDAKRRKKIGEWHQPAELRTRWGRRGFDASSSTS